MAAPPFTLVIVGSGPRGTSTLERVLARLEAADQRRGAEDTPPARSLEITVVDPCEPGPGHVWAPEQPRYYLMNTPALYPTVAPPRGTGNAAGLTFEEFRVGGGDGADLDPAERAELAGLSASGFPSRAIYGRYLRHVFCRVRARLQAHPAVASITLNRADATSHRPEANGNRRTHHGAAGSGPAVTELVAEAVVLAVGHVPAHPNPLQRTAGERATAVGLHYQGPNVPADVDWGLYPAGEPVLVRGLGLNFFDAMTAMTVGRGGSYVSTGD
ncbi:MAG: FAD/NAD(P)-binding protein, partial [Micrococcaceae bacterium]|nr:FAD/NAD(P)-binding protein [Micrococcaceae bacterium]